MWVSRVLRDDHLNGWPVSRYRCGTLKKTRCSIYVKICSPSPAMVTSPNEWKILKWDEKLQENKTHVLCLLIFITRFVGACFISILFTLVKIITKNIFWKFIVKLHNFFVFNICQFIYSLLLNSVKNWEEVLSCMIVNRACFGERFENRFHCTIFIQSTANMINQSFQRILYIY